ncbi:MAG TPA: hypothetical protein VGE88_17490 [Lysobacter sp.]
MTTDLDRTHALRRDLVAAIIRGTGVSEALAMPYAEAILAWMQDQHAGSRLYIPQPPRRYDVLTIDAELRSGLRPEDVAERHGTTVRQLRRLFPGGLPRPEDHVVG